MEEQKECEHKLKREFNTVWEWDVCIYCGKVIGDAVRRDLEDSITN